MALNDIQLNSVHLTDMYERSLVYIEERPKQMPATVLATDKQTARKEGPREIPTIEWRHLGAFKKGILLIVRYPDTTYLPDEQLNFLSSVLSACKLSLSDVAIVNISNLTSAAYQELQDRFRSNVTILFGLTPQELEMPINFPEFQIQPFNNCIFLHTPVLEKLELDKILKSKLWVCLQRMFNLS